jgi:hypothetical protein
MHQVFVDAAAVADAEAFRFSPASSEWWEPLLSSTVLRANGDGFHAGFPRPFLAKTLELGTRLKRSPRAMHVEGWTHRER